MKDKKIRITVDLFEELYNDLTYLANNLHTKKADVLRKSLRVLKVLLEEKLNDNKIIITNEHNERVKEIILL